MWLRALTWTNEKPGSLYAQDEQPKKKVKASTKGLKLGDVLPPPRQAEQGSSEGVLGSGYAKV